MTNKSDDKAAVDAAAPLFARFLMHMSNAPEIGTEAYADLVECWSAAFASAEPYWREKERNDILIATDKQIVSDSELYDEAFIAGRAAQVRDDLAVVKEVANDCSISTSFDWNLACKEIARRIAEGGK